MRRLRVNALSGRTGFWVLLGLGVVLLIAITLSWLVSAPIAHASGMQKLDDRLPMNIDGWSGVDLPLGDTEVLKAAVQLLNYDDYVYRVYRNHGHEVFVYAMFWRQGRISIREIAGHTPDGCWIDNGAEYCAPKREESFQVGQRMTATAEVRDFRFPGGQTVQTAWWHLWGGELVDRGFDQKSIMPALREMWVWLAHRHGRPADQWLIRIHTHGDLKSLMDTPPVLHLLNLQPTVFTARPIP